MSGMNEEVCPACGGVKAKEAEVCDDCLRIYREAYQLLMEIAKRIAEEHP
ncbi:MAG: hypothetical protein QW587_04930 [Candidatus Bathyarchaeia archaeon]